jgi:UDP-N-acetylglucosamine 2-epimerase (non-hydrolysing)
MHKKTIVTVTGIRPDFIRMSQVFKELDSAEWCDHVLIHSGQHYDELLSGVFFKDLQIREPDYNLSIGSAGKSHYQQQADLGPAIINLFHEKDIKPDVVLFLGDSNSVLASVPLRKEGYKVGHIEAGMRSYDERMLEEINRKVCDHVSNFLFVYHENYKNKGLKEGISEDKIFVVGNTINEPLKNIADLSYSGKAGHILLDIHRPENFQHVERLEKIFMYANRFANEFSLPVKMISFGRTLRAIKENNVDIGNVEPIPMMGYKDYIRFQQDSFFIISDSGTAQEEPAHLSIPVVVPRDFTERPESIENGCSILLPLDDSHYLEAVKWIKKWRTEECKTSWMGDGMASKKIVKILRRVL